MVQHRSDNIRQHVGFELLSKDAAFWLTKLLTAWHLPPVISVSPPPNLFCGVRTSCCTRYYSYITARFLSCCDQINLDGSETMNDDITIWALATRHFKNQLAFGQNKRLHRKPNVVWRENFWINRLLHGHCREDCIGSWVTLSYNRKYSDLHCNLHMLHECSILQRHHFVVHK